MQTNISQTVLDSTNAVDDKEKVKVANNIDSLKEYRANIAKLTAAATARSDRHAMLLKRHSATMLSPEKKQRLLRRYTNAMKRAEEGTTLMDQIDTELARIASENAKTEMKT